MEKTRCNNLVDGGDAKLCEKVNQMTLIVVNNRASLLKDKGPEKRLW